MPEIKLCQLPFTHKAEVLPVHAMKAYGGLEEQLHSLITLALDACYQSASGPGNFTLW
jgi:hypothetical protein